MRRISQYFAFTDLHISFADSVVTTTTVKPGHQSALNCFTHYKPTLTPWCLAGCREWCASHRQSWAVKCTWMETCGDCSECAGACQL